MQQRAELTVPPVDVQRSSVLLGEAASVAGVCASALGVAASTAGAVASLDGGAASVAAAASVPVDPASPTVDVVEDSEQAAVATATRSRSDERESWLMGPWTIARRHEAFQPKGVKVRTATMHRIVMR
jgi:hypothetical protein